MPKKYIEFYLKRWQEVFPSRKKVLQKEFRNDAQFMGLPRMTEEQVDRIIQWWIQKL